MNKSHLNHLSDVLGTELNWDASGQCCLEFEDNIEITLSLHDDVVAMRAYLGPGNEHNLRQALSLQYQEPRSGFSMALDDSSNQLFLMSVLAIEDTELIPESVYELLNTTQTLKSQRIFLESTPKSGMDDDTPPSNQNVLLA
jgi:hypothetical protein